MAAWVKVPCGRRAKRNASLFEGEGAVALIEKEQRAAAADDEKVLESVVAKVGEECACGVVEHIDAGLFCHVFEGAIAAIAVEAIGQAGGLADVEVVEAVVVEIADGEAVVAVDIDAAGAIEHGSPVIGAAEQSGHDTNRLRRGRARLLHERGAGGSADGFFSGLPFSCLPALMHCVSTRCASFRRALHAFLSFGRRRCRSGFRAER